LRIGLVSATERTSNKGLRAEQQVAGRSVLEWQVDLALSLGCERIVCLCAEATSDVMIGQQQRVESNQRSFHAVRNHLQLASLVRAEDDLFIQLDGLIVDNEALIAASEAEGETQRCILELEAEHPLSTTYPDDFERIDRERHWGGIAILPGECVVALKEMPEDGDAISLLLRLGLQARVPCERVPAPLLENDRWFLANDAQALEQRGRALIEESLPHPHWSEPVAALATIAVRLSANRWLGSAGEITAGLAIAGMVVAAVLAGFGYGPVGIGFGAVSAFIANLANYAGVMRIGISAHSSMQMVFRALAPAIAALATVVLVVVSLQDDSWQVGVAIPLIAMGLAQIAGKEAPNIRSGFWRDTSTHLVIFATAAAFAVLQTALLVFSLGALLQLMLRAYRKSASPQD